MGRVAGVIAAGCLMATTLASAQEVAVTPDLKAFAQGKGVKIPPDAVVAWVDDAKGRPALKVQSSKDDTILILEGIEFDNGVIEFDALGQSAPPQSSFLGVAFRVAAGAAHDAVYFRPFNFRAPTPERRGRAVQYISAPAYPWQVLRTTKPGQYEKAIVPDTDGDTWFHVRLVVERPTVRVFVNGAEQPSLVVEELSGRQGGGVGLWVGPGEGGHVANLSIRPAK